MEHSIHLVCSHCRQSLEENFDTVPFKWMCYYCGGLYSIVSVKDKENSEE